MELKTKLLKGILAIMLVFAMTIAFAGCPEPPEDIAVTLNSVTAVGGNARTTTQLTLTFSQVIPGLTANDIDLSGVSGVVKGTLTGSGPTYTLDISGVTAVGDLTVTVTKAGYAISGSPKQVGLHAPDKKITINGITNKTGDVYLDVFRLSGDMETVAWGYEESIDNGSVTFTLLDWEEDEPWNGSGSYGLILIFDVDEDNESTYVYSGDNHEFGIYTATSIISFDDFEEYVPPTPVTLQSVTADGNASQTTTQLTLTFSAAITGLTADDITLSGVTGVTKGTLSSTGPTYTLPINGVTVGGTLSVAVAKEGYAVTGSPKAVTIYYVTPGVFPGYAITPSGSNFAAALNGASFQGSTGSIQNVVNAIRNHAVATNNTAVAIQFGNGTDTLNIGSNRVNFLNTPEQTWGEITLSGKITGSDSRTIVIGDGVTAVSTADITNTNSGGSTYAVIVGDNAVPLASLTINGGTITSQGTGEYSYTIRVWDQRAELTINDGTVRMIGEGYAIGTNEGNTTIKGGVIEATSTGNGIRIMGNLQAPDFAVTIDGGVVKATSGRALDIINTGTVNITGGEVLATTGTAVYLRTDGPLNISGGTVEAITGVAIYAASNTTNRPITLSGTAMVTSENVTADQGTIVLAGPGGYTATRLIIGETVTLNNTSGAEPVTNGDTVIRNINNAANVGYVQDDRE